MTADLDRLERWEATGGIWRVVRSSSGSVEVALLTCDGGEEMDRLRSADPELIRYIEQVATRPPPDR